MRWSPWSPAQGFQMALNDYDAWARRGRPEQWPPPLARQGAKRTSYESAPQMDWKGLAKGKKQPVAVSEDAEDWTPPPI